MEIVRDEKLSGATLVLDGKSFINCHYENCTVVYAGGDSSWVNSSFVNCKLVFQGPADRTANILRSFGWKPPEPQSQSALPN